MFIKLLCIHKVDLCNYDGSKCLSINEGDITSALIDCNGVSFKCKDGHYSPSYRFEDVSTAFISAFDEESYNRIYQKVHDVTMHFEDGKYVNLGDAIVKHGFAK